MRHQHWNLTTLALLSGILLLAPQSNAIEADLVSGVNDCDDLGCVNNGGNSNASTSGLQMASGEAPPARVQARTIILNTQSKYPKVNAQMGSRNIQIASIQSTVSQSLRNAQESSAPETEAATSASGQTSTAPQGQAGSPGGFQSSSISGATQGYSRPQVVNGLLYSNDSESPPQNQGNKQVQMSQGALAVQANQMSHNFQRQQNSNRQNKQASALQSRLGSSYSSGQPFQAAASQGSGRSQSVGLDSESQSLLGLIANKLGLDNFFGSQTGSRSPSAVASRGTNGGRNNQGKTDGPLPDPRAVLQAQFDRFRNSQRGLASQLEFAPSQSSLFKSMCQHYQHYAHRNNLPTGRSQSCDLD